MTEIYQIAPQSHTQMMGYVIKADDGRIAVIDGGTALDAPYLLALLHRVAGGVPYVDAWFLTHAHSDHINAFLELQPVMGSLLAVGTVYHAFPTEAFIAQNEAGSQHTIRAYLHCAPKMAAAERVLQAGETIEVGSARFEVLYTADPAFTHNAINNSSTVLRLTADGVKVLFLGDLGIEGGEKLLAEYGDSLKSDLVQMAHHGQSGVALPVYQAVRPLMCLWCTPKWLWDNNQGERGYDSGPWTTLQVAADMRALGVREHVIAKDGTFRIALADGKARAKCIDPYAAL